MLSSAVSFSLPHTEKGENEEVKVDYSQSAVSKVKLTEQSRLHCWSGHLIYMCGCVKDLNTHEKNTNLFLERGKTNSGHVPLLCFPEANLRPKMRYRKTTK